MCMFLQLVGCVYYIVSVFFFLIYDVFVYGNAAFYYFGWDEGQNSKKNILVVKKKCSKTNEKIKEDTI